jgi:hypothetical protein
MPTSSVCHPIPRDSPVWDCLEMRLCVPGMLGIPPGTSPKELSVLCYHAEDSLAVREIHVCTPHTAAQGAISDATDEALEELVRMCGR